MQRRTFLQSAFRTAVPLGLAGAGAGPAAFSFQQPRRTAAAPRPNVIVILTDDQGYGDLSSHGNPVLKTPNMDKLRAASARLTDFHVAPMCTPTRAQLLTGCDAMHTAAINVSSGRTLLRRDLPTMAEIFAGSGYRTGIFGKWHLGDSYPYRPHDRGFEEAVWFPSSHVGSVSDAWNNDYYNDRYRHGDKLQQYEGYCTDVFFREAIAWMRAQQAANQPFFTYIPTNAPHGPLFVPEQYSKPYSSAGHPQPLSNFFGMIANLDENLGKLMDMLRETGMEENTILIFLTDNGGTAGVRLFNAGMRGRKVTLWDGGHRTPCFVRWPAGGVRPGRDIGELTEVQDLLPTLVEFCGLKPPPGAEFDGTSIAPLLRGQAERLPRDRMLVVQFSRMNVGQPQYQDATVMWRKWRLVSAMELYDISKDPGQQDNVIKQHPEVAAKLRAHYEGWWKEAEPRLRSFLPTHIGSKAENPVLVSPTEWADSFLDQGTQVRAGVKQNGTWHINVEYEGQYEFTLRRWPKDVAVPMRAGLPEHVGECGRYAPGVALPIGRAELKVGAPRLSKAVGPEDQQVQFQMQLSEGRTTMHATFFDQSDRELCGAYYVYAERKS